MTLDFTFNGQPFSVILDSPGQPWGVYINDERVGVVGRRKGVWYAFIKQPYSIQGDDLAALGEVLAKAEYEQMMRS